MINKILKGNDTSKVMVAVGREIIENPRTFSVPQLIDVIHDLGEARFDQSSDQHFVEETLRAAGRFVFIFFLHYFSELHPLFYNGLLTPWEVAKLSRGYGMLRYQHSTFSRGCTHIISSQWEAFKTDVIAGLKEFTDDVPQASSESFAAADRTGTNGSMGMVSNMNDETRRYYHFDKNLLEDGYEMGWGIKSQFAPIKEQCLPVDWMNASGPVDEFRFESLNLSQNAQVESNISEKSSTFTPGQAALIMDSLLFSRTHEFAEDLMEPAIQAVLERLTLAGAIAVLDPQQTLSAMVVIARMKRANKDEMLLSRRLTDRMFHLYLSGAASPVQLSLFVKELSYWSSFKRMYRLKTKPQTRFETSRIRLGYLHEKFFSKDALAAREAGLNVLEEDASTPLETICYRVCENVSDFKTHDLAVFMQSVSFLGMNDEGFYRALLPWVRHNLNDLTCEDIQRISQALNHQKINDRTLFRKLGFRHQELQGHKNELHLKHRGELFKVSGA